MRDPIDDIFKKGIGQQKHKFSQEEWMNAKAMLDIEKRKKRFPIWWFGVAAGILLGAIVLYTFQNNPNSKLNTTIAQSDIQQQSALKAQIERSYEKGSNAINNDTEIENAIKDKVDPNYNTGEKIAGDKRLTDKSPSVNIASNTIREINNISQPGLSEIGSNREKELKIVSPSTTSIPTENSSIPKLIAPILISSQNDDLDPVKNKITLTNTDKNSSIDAVIPLVIPYLTNVLNTLETEILLPNISLEYNNQLVKVQEDKRDPWAISLYTAYTIPQSKPSLGFMLNRNLSGRWSASLGAGLGYRKLNRLEIERSLTVVDFNGLVQNSQVSEDFLFRQIMFEIPVSLSYQIGKHSILATGLAEINLWSELSKDAIVNSPDRQDIEPNAPALDLSDPVTIRQQSTTINEPSLSIPKYYLGLGYQFEFSRKLSLQTQGLWNLSSSKESIESAFASNSANNNLSESRWHLRTSLLFRF